MEEGRELILSLRLGRHSKQSSASSSPPESDGWSHKGIDINQAPAGTWDGDEEEDAGARSQNSTESSVLSGSAKRTEREHHPNNGDDNDEEDGSEGSRKKLRLSREQSLVLEDSFREHNTLNQNQKLALAKQLNLRPRQVEVWFQNRRARTKLKKTEVDCEVLKRRCDSLMEENRRLHKELQEVRALKLSTPTSFAHTPPATLTMCPSCERLSASAADQKPLRRILPRPPAKLLS